MSFELKSTSSTDGTNIAYYKLGRGPGLIIVHGAMQSGQSHTELATILSSHFTCYLPDRRGRGQSGPMGDNYSPAKEVADLQSLVCETRARFIFGVSSGALLTLKTALATSLSSSSSPSPPRSASYSASSPSFKRIAVLDPPWWPEAERATTTAWVKRYEDELQQGELAEALTTAMLGSKMGPPFLHSRYLPRWAVVSVSKLLLRGGSDGLASMPGVGIGSTNASGISDGSPPPSPATIQAAIKTLPAPPSFGELASTLRSDVLIGQDMFGEAKLRALAPVTTETLILGTEQSPGYMQRSTRELEKVLPNARRVEIKGVNHTVTGNRDQLGNPGLVARELRRFFLGEGENRVE